MFNPLVVLAVIVIWLKKCNSLPKLYHGICSRRGIPVSTFRSLEKHGHKLVKLNLDVKYFESCLDLNLCPEFLKFKAPNLSVYRDGRYLFQAVVRKKLKEVKKDKRIAESRFKQQKKDILGQLSFLEKTCLTTLLDKEFKRIAVPHIKIHEKKLFNLWRKQSDKCPDAIVNLSKRKLDLKEQNALRFGLNHPILPKKVQKDKIKTQIEKLAFLLKRNTDVNVDDEIKDDIKFLVKRFVEEGTRACSTRQNQSLHRTINKLSQDSSIKVCKFDKGNGVAILQAEDYLSKLAKIVNDKSKFEEVNYQSGIHPLIAKENSIAYYVRRYFKKVEGYTNLIPSGSKPGKLYGMAKVHKPNVPLRPVVSMIGTPEYKLAKFLDSLIKPYIPDTYLLKSTDEFIDRLKLVPCTNKNTMVSFDVISLFTNVPLAETIELIINRIYDDNNPNAVPFEKDVFRKLMFMATQGIFMFNDRMYKQIDGVTMGSPLGPTLANFFLGHIEEQIFANNNDVLPKIYLRYVDDVYAVFDNQNTCSRFLDVLNMQHKNIRFTIEKATETLSFLDVEIKLHDNGYDTRVWRKKTNTGLLLNFNANCPKTWKSGLIMCFLHRAKIICSTFQLYRQEVEKLRVIFHRNAYPNWFINNIVDKFEKQSNANNANDQSKSCEKKFFVFYWNTI